jgi:hypothetical protein
MTLLHSINFVLYTVFVLYSVFSPDLQVTIPLTACIDACGDQCGFVLLIHVWLKQTTGGRVLPGGLFVTM